MEKQPAVMGAASILPLDPHPSTKIAHRSLSRSDMLEADSTCRSSRHPKRESHEASLSYHTSASHVGGLTLALGVVVHCGRR
ncbi:MAG TPA: hypothetical protein VFA10_30295 [Ktedonobacteraceae bacterium]|jgi:hypothetical protein|nr:hypothetical protein [Ktedonobacteraceae bacterium]